MLHLPAASVLLVEVLKWGSVGCALVAMTGRLPRISGWAVAICWSLVPVRRVRLRQGRPRPGRLRGGAAAAADGRDRAPARRPAQRGRRVRAARGAGSRRSPPTSCRRSRRSGSAAGTG
nr:hypothetical protein [Angustibacter aerolatus]